MVEKETIIEYSNNKFIINLDNWIDIEVSDVDPHILFQKIEETIEIFKNELIRIENTDTIYCNLYLKFYWALQARDYLLFLRDCLLASVKHKNYLDDDLDLNQDFDKELHLSIVGASYELYNSYYNRESEYTKRNVWKYQKSPINTIVGQIDEINIQVKKIYRSLNKIADLRLNLDGFEKDFQFGYTKQTKVVQDILDIVENVKSQIRGLLPTASKQKISKVVDSINQSYVSLEMFQSLKSMGIIQYDEKETITIPMDTNDGELIYKTINPFSELSKWYSSFVHPHTIELENKRNSALELTLNTLNNIRSKLVRLTLDDEDEVNVANANIIHYLEKNTNPILSSLKEQEEENTELLNEYFRSDLQASNVYNDAYNFVPVTSDLLTGFSRGVQERFKDRFEKYRSRFLKSLRSLLNRFIELEKIPYGKFIDNKLKIDSSDDRLSLFLKKGFLGKSFTVPREEEVGQITQQYELWKNGFAGSVLLTGPSGIGKSTLLGMLSQGYFNEELIQLVPGETYFTNYKVHDPTYDLKEAVLNVGNQNIGNKVIVFIDDLEMWHNDDLSHFTNVSRLLDMIIKFRKRIFFVVASGEFLLEKMDNNFQLETVFSKMIKLGKMPTSQLRKAIQMRVNALPELGLKDDKHDNNLGIIVRHAKGNIGMAMMEYSRFFHADFIASLRSNEFDSLIRNNDIIKFILSRKFITNRELSKTLNETDFKHTMKEIDYLISQKILVRQHGKIAVNSNLTYTIERSLKKAII